MQAHSYGEDNDIKEIYNNLVKNKTIKSDKEQQKAVEHLLHLQHEIENKKEKEFGGFFKKLFCSNNKNTTKGVYLFGDVGRGKSMLMDLFFETLKYEKKRRIHFHAFMLEIHSKLYKWRHENKNGSDPIPYLAEQIAKKADVICLDELQVTDITDAMLVGRVFENLYEHKVIVIATSNRHPQDLYKDGLQRESFLGFIDLIIKNTEIVMLDSDQDYRLKHIKSLSTVYFTPLDKKAEKFMKKTFDELTNNAKYSEAIIKVKGRKVVLPRVYNDVAWADFSDLCEKPLGAEDYIEIAKEFSTLLISSIPKFNKLMRNEAKRFVTLIDELYEHNVKLICTAEVEPNELYVKGHGNFEFKRTASRLVEMQSEEYLKKQHLS